MNNRIDFRNFLETFCKNLYFQPPANIQMKYPAIVYKINSVDTNHANNKPYTSFVSYQLTVIDKDPDSVIFRELLKAPMCVFNRSYTSDNLNHFIFTIYY